MTTHIPSPDQPEPLQPTVFDVKEERLGRIYAEAFINAAAATGDPAFAVDELRSLINEVFGVQPQVEAFLSSLAVSRERKGAAIKAAFDGRVSQVLLHFLLVLNQHGRLDLLRVILTEAVSILDWKKQVVRVEVRSAVPMMEEQQERLLSELRDVLVRSPILQFTVDPELLGGLVVRVDDFQYDASVRTQLASLRNQLIEKGTYARN
jgi:F-type H+-transporting ATPase subunit delta